ncbi:hypothetical protein [Tychonema sp. LEGE 06208]|uniref:hypothetical protein n=1 Tax=Tychonema sp. LEGE 06208 TaxID=1828663 RepID=UPI00187FFEBF|nr:hypothetical protein [Tychonema sp. LEGE 06208]MBE9164315.1 hypothetical protein [Tychonema sp. LEGE 06208]
MQKVSAQIQGRSGKFHCLFFDSHQFGESIRAIYRSTLHDRAKIIDCVWTRKVDG